MANRILYSFFLILVLVAICRTQREPRCSKYDFEEKVLEKLIRMEHSNELIMEEFRQISTSVKEDIETMKGKLTEIQRQAKEEQARLKAFVEDNLIRPSYVFDATWIENLSPSIGDAIIFSRDMLNEKGVYNKDSGKFTAPVNGTYMFTATLCLHGNKYVKVQFVADDAVLGSFLAGNNQATSLCSASSVYGHLHKGSQVWLKVVERNTSGTLFINSETGYMNQFAGHLIH